MTALLKLMDPLLDRLERRSRHAPLAALQDIVLGEGLASADDYRFGRPHRRNGF